MSSPQPGTPEYDQMIHDMVTESTAASGVPYHVEDPAQIAKIVAVFEASAGGGAPASPPDQS